MEYHRENDKLSSEKGQIKKLDVCYRHKKEAKNYCGPRGNSVFVFSIFK